MIGFYARDIDYAFWKINLQTRVDGSESGIQPIPMNYFDAVEVFFALMESKPCWQRGE